MSALLKGVDKRSYLSASFAQQDIFSTKENDIQYSMSFKKEKERESIRIKTAELRCFYDNRDNAVDVPTEKSNFPFKVQKNSTILLLLTLRSPLE